MDRQILVVEDDDLSAELMVRTIDRCTSCASTLAANGKIALDLINASERQFDLILLDLSLPDVDGLEFIRLLADTSFNGSVVIVSGHSKAVLKAAEQLADFHQITVLATLQKPVSPSDLRNVIQKEALQPTASEIKISTRDRDIAGSQIIPHYQPQINTNSGAVVGFEALLRLQLADGPIVGPDALFSRIRNEPDRISTTLLITQLVLKDLRNAIDQISYFPGISMNFDARILEDAETMTTFACMVRDAGISPKNITVEVIEKSLPLSDAKLLETLIRLSMDGFRLSLDDYGVGGSNQDLLRRSPFNELKLDHKLIQSGLTDTVSKKFVSTAVDTARELELDLVGEGVETQEHLDFVQEMGINTAQGFLFGRPMPIENAIDFLVSQENLKNIA